MRFFRIGVSEHLGDRFKDIGIGISLDDFGTGYSSLSCLKRFPIDVLKIDKSFVDAVTTSGNDAAIALSVISLGHNPNLHVIAEGARRVRRSPSCNCTLATKCRATS